MYKTSFLFFFLHIGLSHIVYSQESSLIKKTPLYKKIDPLQQTVDQWQTVLINETVEQFAFDEELERIKKEKLKKKLANTSRGIPSPPPTNKIELTLGQSFQGISKGMNPHDNGTAVGNGNYFVHSVNSAIMITDLVGTQIYSNSLKKFFEVNGTPVDPRAIFDPYEGKWIVVAIPTNSTAVHIAFSEDENPTGKWNIYTVDVDAGGEKGIYDYPHCGVTENELILTGKVGGTCYCVQINKFDGYKGTDLTSKEYKVNGPRNTTVVNIGKHESKFGNKAYLIGSNGRGGNSVDLFIITDVLGGNPKLEKSTIKIDNSFSPGGNAPQKDGKALDALDCRIFSSIYTDGKIHFATHSDYKESGYHAILYGIVDIDKKTAKSYFFNKPNTDLQFPSIASFTEDGETEEIVLIYFLEVSSKIFPGSSAIVCDENGNWSSSLTVKEGLGVINGGGNRNRWGDYTSCSRKHDSKKPTGWVSGEYGSKDNRSSWNAEIRTKSTTDVPLKILNKQEAKVYPNPVVLDFFKVKFHLDQNTPIIIDLYDFGGKKIITLYDDNALAGKNELSFNRSNLKPGIYILKINGNDGQLIQQNKIVIQ